MLFSRRVLSNPEINKTPDIRRSVAALGMIGIAIVGCNQDEADPSITVTETANTDIATENTSSGPTETEQDTEPSSPELATNYEPLPLDATTPRELAEQLNRNYLCIFNARDPIIQNECIDYTVGHNTAGPLTQNLRQVAEDARNYRLNTDPNWSFENEYEIIDSSHALDEEFSRLTIETIFIIRVIEPGVEAYKRVHFQRGTLSEVTINQESLGPDEVITPVWKLVGDRVVEPGTTVTID